jgi:hypothetical protein
MDFIVSELVNSIDTLRAYGLFERVWGVAAEGVYWGDW